MKLFLWRQKHRRIESSILLQWAIEAYETAKQNTDEYGESDPDSLFEFIPEAMAQEPDEAGLQPEVHVIKDSKGKPVVVDENGEPYPLYVSVTHTGEWWICAVGETSVGIDAELRNRRVDPKLVRRICTKEELQWLEQELTGVPDELRDERTCEKLLWLWVRKEAYVKYLGTGIGEGLKTFSVVQKGTTGDFCEKAGYRGVDLCGIPEAEETLVFAVYAPNEEIEEIRWMKW